jgi:hypothetical protein
MIRRMFRMQTNQEVNASPNSDFQRLLVALQNWWSLVSRQLDQDFTDLQEQISAIPVATSKSQVFTANGTFTAEITGWHDAHLGGGGGGSGGVSTSGFAAGSSGAGAGQEINARIYLTVGETVAVVVGAAGLAGAATPTAGGNGGDTTITVAGLVYRARGGQGSASVNNLSGAAVYGAIGRGGHTIPDSTASRNAQIIAGGAIEGANGALANVATAGGACGAFSGGISGVARAGGGGASSLGDGGAGAQANGSGTAGQGFGAGAGGSLRTSSGSAAGAAGGAGRAAFSWVG